MPSVPARVPLPPYHDISLALESANRSLEHSRTISIVEVFAFSNVLEHSIKHSRSCQPLYPSPTWILTRPTVSKTTLQSNLLPSSFASLSARFENRYGCRGRSWLNRALKNGPCQVITENFRTQRFISWCSISVRSQARRNSLSFPRLVCYSEFRFRVRN